MIWSGGMAWIADFPDASNFYSGVLGCGGAVKGGWNWSWYCVKPLDEKAAKANAIVDPAKTPERLALWKEVFAAVMDDAPWLPSSTRSASPCIRRGWAARTRCSSTRSTSR